MRKHPQTHYTTSAVTPGRYLEVFEKAAEEGLPIIYMGLSEGLSSSINAARQAADMLREKRPGTEIYVLDNRCDSAAGELLAIEVVRQASNGLTARELYDWASDARFFIHGYFTLDSFDALAAGGRIPPAAANVGGKLDIKPELSYDLNGALTLRGMCRGRKKALRAIIQDFRDNYAHDPSLPLAIVSTDAEKDADWLEHARRRAARTSPSFAPRSRPSWGPTWDRAWWPSSSGAPTAARSSRSPTASPSACEVAQTAAAMPKMRPELRAHNPSLGTQPGRPAAHAPRGGLPHMKGPSICPQPTGQRSPSSAPASWVPLSPATSWMPATTSR